MTTLRHLCTALAALALTACVSDDTDLQPYIDEITSITPIDIALDYSPLDEPDDTPVTDVNDPYYADYVENDDFVYVVNITFEEDNVEITGPLAHLQYMADGAHLTIASSSSKMHYVVTGESSDGSIKFYSEHKFRLTLDGVNLTSSRGAAINNQCSKTLYLELADGTVNSLTDAEEYYYEYDDEDMKGAIFSEGQIVFSGSGTLNVDARGRHGIVSDDYLRFRPGNQINVNCSSGNGVKANDGIFIDGGVLNVSVTADGAKGITCDKHIEIRGGRTTVITAGNSRVGPDELDPALLDTVSAAAVKCDSTLLIAAGTVNLKSTGEGGKGIKTAKPITITGGALAIVTLGEKLLQSPKAIKCDQTVAITGGDVYCYSHEAKPLDADLGLTLAPGHTTLVNLPRLFHIIY